MSVRRSLLVLWMLTLGLPVVVFGARANRAAQNSFQNIQLYRVQRGDLEIVVTAIGAIEADQSVSLSFVVPGRVSEVPVQVGDYVLQGEVLVKLTNTPQRIAYDQALLALDRANLQMEDLLAPVDEDDIRIAQANVDSAWGAYMSIENAVSPDDIRAAELAYEQAYQAWQDAQKARDQSPGGTTPTANTLLNAQEGAASFNAEIARLQLEALKNANRPQLNAAYARVLQAQRELERVKAGPTQFEIDQADLAIRQAQAQLDRAEAAYRRTTLTAPFDGFVSAVNVDVGALVAPGMTVVELADVSPLRLTVQVDEIDIDLIREGMPVQVRLDALPGVVLPARLDRIALVGRNENGIVAYDVQVTLDQNDPRARVGMTAEASIVVDKRENVLVVPNIYIRLERANGRAFANVLRDDGTLEEVEVVLGLQGADSSEVLSGLREGDLIAIDLSSDTFSFLGG